jgi:hypothetical protein
LRGMRSLSGCGCGKQADPRLLGTSWETQRRGPLQQRRWSRTAMTRQPYRWRSSSRAMWRDPRVRQGRGPGRSAGPSTCPPTTSRKRFFIPPHLCSPKVSSNFTTTGASLQPGVAERRPEPAFFCCGTRWCCALPSSTTASGSQSHKWRCSRRRSSRQRVRGTWRLWFCEGSPLAPESLARRPVGTACAPKQLHASSFARPSHLGNTLQTKLTNRPRPPPALPTCTDARAPRRTGRRNRHSKVDKLTCPASALSPLDAP